MKTKHQAHRKGGSKSASSQAPNKPETAKGKAQSQPYKGKVNIDTWDPKGVALVLMSGSEAGPEEEIAGLNYSEVEFARIKAIAGDSAQGLSAFLHSAIELRLNRFEAMDEMERAIDQAEALYELMQHQVFFPDGGGHVERIMCGMVELQTKTFDRLRQARAQAGALAGLKGGAR